LQVACSEGRENEVVSARVESSRGLGMVAIGGAGDALLIPSGGYEGDG